MQVPATCSSAWRRSSRSTSSRRHWRHFIKEALEAEVILHKMESNTRAFQDAMEAKLIEAFHGESYFEYSSFVDMIEKRKEEVNKESTRLQMEQHIKNSMQERMQKELVAMRQQMEQEIRQRMQQEGMAPMQHVGTAPMDEA